MEKDRRGHVDGVDGGGLKSYFEVGEDLDARVGGGLFRIAGDESLEAAAWLGKDGGDDAASCDVANTDDQPANHDVISVNDLGFIRELVFHPCARNYKKQVLRLPTPAHKDRAPGTPVPHPSAQRSCAGDPGFAALAQKDGARERTICC